MSNLNINISLPTDGLKFKIRVSTSDGYQTLGEGDFSMDQIQPFLKALDEGTGSNITRTARQFVYHNKLEKERRLERLKKQVEELEAEIEKDQD